MNNKAGDATSNWDSKLKLGRQIALNIQYSARRHMMSTVADPLKNETIRLFLGWPESQEDLAGQVSCHGLAAAIPMENPYCGCKPTNTCSGSGSPSRCGPAGRSTRRSGWRLRPW